MFECCKRKETRRQTAKLRARKYRNQLRQGQIDTLGLVPTRIASRIWGTVNDVPLPTFLRKPVYHAWTKVFGVKLEEADTDDIGKYPSLQQFFTRAVKPGTHDVCPTPGQLVSPVDGRVVSMCEVNTKKGVLEQVKGVDYHVADFLGFEPKVSAPGNKIYSCVIYLSPGDYHRYHSPTEWLATSRTHFTGQLLPVNKLFVNTVPSLFAVNERVAVLGEWDHGFFSYTAVGAYNVGSMTLNFDPELRTNRWRSRRGRVQAKVYDAPVPLARGEEMGLFKLGSTIVMVFEAPDGLEWAVGPGEKVRMGQPMFTEPLAEPKEGVLEGPRRPPYLPSVWKSPSRRSSRNHGKQALVEAVTDSFASSTGLEGSTVVEDLGSSASDDGADTPEDYDEEADAECGSGDERCDEEMVKLSTLLHRPVRDLPSPSAHRSSATPPPPAPGAGGEDDGAESGYATEGGTDDEGVVERMRVRRARREASRAARREDGGSTTRHRRSRR